MSQIGWTLLSSLAALRNGQLTIVDVGRKSIVTCTLDYAGVRQHGGILLR